MSASPLRVPPVTGFRFLPRPLSVTPPMPQHEPPAPRFAPPPSAPSAPSALHDSPRPAPVLPMTTPIVDAPTSSVHRSSTPCLALTSRQLLGSSPPATSPRSRHPPRYAHRRRRRSRPRRWRWLPIIIAAGDAVHVHDAADHHRNVRTAPVTATVVNVSVMTITARQLHRGARCNSKQLAASPRDRTACRLRRVVSLGSPPSATSLSLTPSTSLTLAVSTPGFRVRLADAGSARHRLPHFAFLYCPFHCRRPLHVCTCLRQRAPHDCLQFSPHSPPLNRRGGSHPPGPPVPIPLRSYPGFVVPDRVPRLWFSHRTQLAAGVHQARAFPAFQCALDDTGCRAYAGTSVFSRAYTPPSHPCRPKDAHVAQPSRDVFSSVAEHVTACYIV